MSNPFDLTGKRILVTGASSGIGRAIAVECSKMGAELVLLGRNELRLIETKEQLKGDLNHTYFSVDFGAHVNFDDLCKSISIIGPIDGLVNCAGIIERKPLKFIESNKFRELIEVNLISGIELIKKLIKSKLINVSGSIVSISSVAKDYAALGNIMYMATKGALNSASRGLALELSRNKIRVNTIEPGLIVSNLTRGISELELNENLALYPLGRFGNPSDVAFGCIYLLSDASSWITGTTIRIDGGLTLK